MHLEDGIAAIPDAAAEGRRSILLIGDSIRLGYCRTVRETLADIADVVYPEGNCRNTQFILTSMNAWRALCSPDSVAAVYFNAGHWDAAHWDGAQRSLTTVEEYEHNIGEIIARLRCYYRRAAIIYATTTPMNPNGVDGRNPRSNEEIRNYNAAGLRAVAGAGGEDAGVFSDDLYACLADADSTWYADYCHLTPEGYNLIGTHAASTLRAHLGDLPSA